MGNLTEDTILKMKDRLNGRSSLGGDLQSPLAGTARTGGEVETSELDEKATHHSIQTQVFAR